MLSEHINYTTPSWESTAPAPARGPCPPVGIQLEGLILPPVLTIDVILGILGNILSLWIFCFKLKAWNPNNLFLFNLVIADFLALVSLPLRIDALIRRYWLFGDGICRINLFLMFTNRSASIALMTVVAIYRYFKVRNFILIFWAFYFASWQLYRHIKGIFISDKYFGTWKQRCRRVAAVTKMCFLAKFDCRKWKLIWYEISKGGVISIYYTESDFHVWNSSRWCSEETGGLSISAWSIPTLKA